jgi:hypothetical protein
MARQDLTTIQIKKATVAPLEQIAEARGVPRAVVIRWAIEHYLSLFLADGSNISTDGTVRLFVPPQTQNTEPLAN